MTFAWTLALSDLALLASLFSVSSRRRIPLDGFDVAIIIGFLFFAVAPILLANILFDERWGKADRYLPSVVYVLGSVVLFALGIVGAFRIAYHWEHTWPDETAARATGHILLIVGYMLGCLGFSGLNMYFAFVCRR